MALLTRYMQLSSPEETHVFNFVVTKSVTLCDHPHDALPQDNHQVRERPDTTRRQAKLVAALNAYSGVPCVHSWHTTTTSRAYQVQIPKPSKASWTEKEGERSDEGKQLRLLNIYVRAYQPSIIGHSQCHSSSITVRF